MMRRLWLAVCRGGAGKQVLAHVVVLTVYAGLMVGLGWPLLGVIARNMRAQREAQQPVEIVAAGWLMLQSPDARWDAQAQQWMEPGR
jgi:hypothetical protein